MLHTDELYFYITLNSIQYFIYSVTLYISAVIELRHKFPIDKFEFRDVNDSI